MKNEPLKHQLHKLSSAENLTVINLLIPNFCVKIFENNNNNYYYCKSNHSQRSLQRQLFLGNFFKTPTVCLAKVQAHPAIWCPTHWAKKILTWPLDICSVRKPRPHLKTSPLSSSSRLEQQLNFLIYLTDCKETFMGRYKNKNYTARRNHK